MALSILTDYLGGDKRTAGMFYQDFKQDFVAKFGERWELASDVIESWLKMRYQTLSKNTGAAVPERFR